MQEKIYDTECGPIHYWVGAKARRTAPQPVFLPGLTADHRLFEKQLAFFEGRYPLLVWDAPGHAASWPFELTFTLMDKARWLDEILAREGFDAPVLICRCLTSFNNTTNSTIQESMNGIIEQIEWRDCIFIFILQFLCGFLESRKHRSLSTGLMFSGVTVLSDLVEYLL